MSSRSAAVRTWRSLEALAGTTRGAVLVFAAALCVYGLESVAMPLAPGRDLGTYLQYYDQFFHGTALPMVMLFRTPGAPLVIGPALDFLGGWGSQVLMGFLFAVTVTSWSAVAALFGRRVAVLTAIALVLFPGYGMFFHRISSDQIFAAAFALWALLFVRTIRSPTALRMASLGLGVALLTLIRPGNQVLVVFAVFPLCLRIAWRERLTGALVFAAAAVIGLGGWAVHNGLRYGDYTVARGNGAFLPFFRMVTTDHVVSPANGPASRELGEAVRTHLLTKEPYRSYGVTLDAFFSRADTRMHEDLLNLSDQVWGWDSNYSKLRAAAWEALQKHPARYARGVLHTLDLEFRGVEIYDLPVSSDSKDNGPGETIVVHGKRVPKPEENSLIPSARMGLSSATSDGHIREVWTSPTEHRVVFDDPADQRRYDEMGNEVGRLRSKLPTYTPLDLPRRTLNVLSRAYPRTVLWLLVGLIAVCWRRPRGAWAVLALAGGALLVIVVTALAIFPVLEYALPLAPAFVLLGLVGLAGERSQARTTGSLTSVP